MNWKHNFRFLAQKALGLDQISRQVAQVRNQLELTRKDLLFGSAVNRSTRFLMEASAGVAAQSVDHLLPKGTGADNTRWPRLAVWAERRFGRKINFLDMGCSGGGLVFDFLLAGHGAAGVEGSDLSARSARAEWGTIPESLFVADITKPFQISADDPKRGAEFDLITAWEVLEHIPEPDLPQLFENIQRHLSIGGIFAASVATFEDVDSSTGMRWHQTVKPKEWWLRRVSEIAPSLVEDEAGWVPDDFPRGSGNPYIPWDWDAKANPELGFHLVLRKGQRN